MLMRTLLLIFALSFGFTAHSAVTNFQILDGTSRLFDIRVNQDAWGVMAGPIEDPDIGSSACSPQELDNIDLIFVDPTKPYDSCAIPTRSRCGTGPAEILPCHPNRVEGLTEISIRFTETSDYTGARVARAVFTPIVANGETPNPIEVAESANLFTTGQVISLEFTWGDICTRVFGGTINGEGRCVDNSTTPETPLSGDAQIQIGITDNTPFGFVSSQTINFRLYTPDKDIGTLPLGDSSGTPTPCESTGGIVTPDFNTTLTGVCSILPIPGDGSVFLESSLSDFQQQTRFISGNIAYPDSLATTATTERSVNINYTGIRLYLFPGSDPATFFPFSDAAVVRDLDIDSPVPFSLDEKKISNIENGQTYTVLAASIDESGTISQFMLPLDSITNPGDLGYCSNGNIPDAAIPSIGFCPQVTPSQVAGVIVDSSCFITTATYGSKSAYQVQIFQDFRERYLRGHALGDWVINKYNSYGPNAAVFINNNSYLKPIARGLLFPFYLFSKFSLNFGITLTLTILGVFLFLLSLMLRKRFH